MPGDQTVPPTPARTKREARSRKGCPECRSRKIKCDEQRPECGQCLKTGRTCRIIDSLFKPHSYSFLTAPPKKTSSTASLSPSREKNSGGLLPQDDAPANGAVRSIPESGEEPAASTAKEEQRNSATKPSNVLSSNGSDQPLNYYRATSNDNGKVNLRRGSGYNPAPINQRRGSSAWPHGSRHNTPSSYGEESYQDRCEIAFFLRHFSEGPGQWMGICGSETYFSQNIVVLSHWSPLVRYAACALGAKQLGQTRHPESQIRQTNTQILMMKALIDTRLGFTWYGAKYYERAIQLLAKQISNRDRSSYSMSPNYIYELGLTPQGSSHTPAHDGDEDRFLFQIIAACILCQYEDVNATIRAWSGHLDGVFRLLRPHLADPGLFQVSVNIPQPGRALDAIFWFVVVNDMLNAFVTRRKTRIDPEDLALWHNMGVPLDGYGNLVADFPPDVQLENILFKALVRIMCQMLNSDLGDHGQWSKINDIFDRWQSTVPSSFYIPIAWPPVEPSSGTNIDPFTREIWFASDVCAITLAFYHMARMILLANRPINLFIQQTGDGHDLLGTYNTLQQDLRKHAMEIIPIMHAMPSETVQKYMLQPLYVAGRSLTDDKERRSLLQILRDMGDDFGLFTDYRIQDLCDEWGMPYDGIDRRDGHGILT
ncbi:hypothetical protein BDW62DRAFT_106330 [Aspergillus aurantiobrunneus]